MDNLWIIDPCFSRGNLGNSMTWLQKGSCKSNCILLYICGCFLFPPHTRRSPQEWEVAYPSRTGPTLLRLSRPPPGCHGILNMLNHMFLDVSKHHNLPSGKYLHNYGNIHHFQWVNQLQMAIFKSFLTLCMFRVGSHSSPLPAIPRIDYEPTANWYNWTYRCLPAAAKVPADRLSSLEILKWGTQHDPDSTYIKRRLEDKRRFWGRRFWSDELYVCI